MIPCTCGRDEKHHPSCPVAQAFRFRCPECRSRRQPDGTYRRHANHCPFKEVTRP